LCIVQKSEDGRVDRDHINSKIHKINDHETVISNIATSANCNNNLYLQVEALHNEQANADFSVLCELLKDYIALTGAIKVGYEGESFSDPQRRT
jgi:hypothetical protein